MIAYASRTGTRRNLAALWGAGWRLLVSAKGVLRDEGFRYALDNGAWSAHQRGLMFDKAAFKAACRWALANEHPPDWVVAPDVVGRGYESLLSSVCWLPALRVFPRVLIAVQDGLNQRHVRPWLSSRVGIFLGGSTEWKLATMRQWGALAREVGCYYHVGRVNSARRIRMCQDAGAHSFDGTSVSRFAVTLPRLDAAVRQGHLFVRSEERR